MNEERDNVREQIRKHREGDPTIPAEFPNKMYQNQMTLLNHQ